MNHYYDYPQNSFANSEEGSVELIGIKSKLEEFDALNDEIHRKKKKLKKLKKKGGKGKKKAKREMKELKIMISNLENQILQYRASINFLGQLAVYLYSSMNQRTPLYEQPQSFLFNEKVRRVLPQVLGVACGTLASNVITGKGKLKLPFGK